MSDANATVMEPQGAIQAPEGPQPGDSPPGTPESPPRPAQAQETTPKKTSTAAVPGRAGIRKGTNTHPAPTAAPAPAAEKPAQAADGEPEKRPVGRPRKNTSEYIPPPPEAPARKNLDDEVFLDYWRSCHRQDENRYSVYVYRQWPVIDRKQIDPSNTKNIAILPAPFNSTCSDGMLRLFGSGTYKLILHDSKTSKSVIWIGNLNYRDEDYPPVVDSRELVKDDPANRSYIARMHERGHMDNNERDRNSEEDEAMSSHVVGPLVETIREMTQDSRRRDSDRPPEVSNIGAIVQNAVAAAMDGVTRAQELSGRIVEQASAQALSVQAKQSDPVSMVREIGTLIRDLSPPNNTDRVLELMMEQQRAFQEQLLAVQREASDTMKQIMLSRQPDATERQPNILDRIQELREIKMALFDDRSSVTEEAETAVQTAKKNGGGGGTDWVALASMLMPMVGMVMQGISQAAYSYGVGLRGEVPAQPGQPGAGQPGAGQPGQQPQGPGNPAGPPQYPFQPTRTPEEDQAMMMRMFLAQLKDPLLLALQNGESGHEFADKLVQLHGKMAYYAIAEHKADGIVQLLSTYPPIWNEISKVPQQFNVFLAEFLTYDEYLQQEEEAQGAQQPQQQRTVANPRRVVNLKQ